MQVKMTAAGGVRTMTDTPSEKLRVEPFKAAAHNYCIDSNWTKAHVPFTPHFS
jgi:hypothetical protein